MNSTLWVTVYEAFIYWDNVDINEVLAIADEWRELKAKSKFDVEDVSGGEWDLPATVPRRIEHKKRRPITRATPRPQPIPLFSPQTIDVETTLVYNKETKVPETGAKRSSMGRKKILTTEQVRRTISQWLLIHGQPPTVEEIRQELNVGSKRTILRYLEELEEQGVIERWPGARGIRLKGGEDSGNISTRSIPVVGTVTAGPLSLSEENIDTWLKLPVSMLKPASDKFFLLRVTGDSMNQAQVGGQTIEAGDLVLVHQQFTANDGQIIVALVDGETTVKRLTTGPGYVLLKPESDSSDYQPIMVEDNLAIQGVVVKVIKKGSELLAS